VYSERYRRQLIEGTGCDVEHLDPPNEYIRTTSPAGPFGVNG